MSSLPDLRELLAKGLNALSDDKTAKNSLILDHPRVGSVGCVADDGNVYGVCHRKAYMRTQGIEEQVDIPTRIMWSAGGEANEWFWERTLDAAGARMRRDVEVRIEIEGVPNPVLGHPDGVFADGDVATLGVELKGVFSFNTANTVLGGRPKNDNLIQAATYARALGIPFVLVYTSASYVTVPIWAKKDYPGQTTLRPFIKVFHLEWRGNELWYRDELSEEWVFTVVTWSGIENYYRAASTGHMGPRVNTNYVNGDPNKWGAHGDCKFCPYNAACTQYEVDGNYDNWIGSVK